MDIRIIFIVVSFPLTLLFCPKNAYITNATVSLYKKTDSSSTDFNIVLQNGMPTYPHVPLQTGDYNKNHYSGNGGSLNTVNFVNGRNNITLTNLSWINASGLTKLCLRSSRDISGTAPTGTEYVIVYSREKTGFIDYNPQLIITYRNQSKIKNNGVTNISGYLLMQVQFYNTSQSAWVVDNDTVNETSVRTINSSCQLALDAIFNGLIKTSDLSNGGGPYRVYASFRSPSGDILVSDDGVSLCSWYSFAYIIKDP